MKSKIIKHLILLALPLLLKYVFFLVFVDWRVFNGEDLIEDLVFFSLIAILISTRFFQNTCFKYLLISVYLLCFVSETTSYLAVSSTFSSSYMYLLLESSSVELKEFTSAYFNWPILISLSVFIYLFFVLSKIKWSSINKSSNLMGFASLILIILFLKLTGLIESNAYHNVVRGIYGYYDLQKNMQFSGVINKSELEIAADNDILVLVLGESTDRNHMELYGYNKPTTPSLSKYKNELLVYDNVISTDVFTLKAVPKILTSLHDNFNSDSLINIVQVFRAAGYDTYWLSNQRPISYHDNAISKIASGCNTFKFYNHLIDRDTQVLDEVMLPEYEKILNQPGKKLIVLRLIGTHFDYDNRYPKSFNKFDKIKSNSKKEKLINQYDNAVLYNDFVVSNILSKLKEKNQKSALLYLSDHGENIYDNGTDFFGRSEEIITQNMFEIPFIFWTSETFDKPADFMFEKNRSFMSQYTFDSLGHVFGVMHPSMDISNSIFSDSYHPKKRIIVGDKNYDTYFKVKE